MPGSLDTLKDIRAVYGTLKNIRAVYGAIPFVCGVFNNFVTQAIPITPLLRGLAALILIVFCTHAILWALSFSNDVPKDAPGNAKLRKCSAGALISGLILMFGYFAFATHFNQHDVLNPVLNAVVDVAQVVLFALPWIFWSFSVVLAAPRK